MIFSSSIIKPSASLLLNYQKTKTSSPSQQSFPLTTHPSLSMPFIFSRQRGQNQLPRLSNPPLTLNRPTILLACICVLRLHTDIPDHLITFILLRSFPDMPLRIRDVRMLFDHTCVNRPGWVREMRVASIQDEIIWGTMLLLRSNVMADVNLFPLAAGEGGRGGGLRYIAALIECEGWRA